MSATTEDFINQTQGQLDASYLNGFRSENNNLIVSSGQTLVVGDWSQTDKAVSIYSSKGDFYKEAAGSAPDVYVLEGSDAQRQVFQLKDGMRFRFRVVNANTGPSTVDINSLGAKNLFNGGIALSSGMINAGDIVQIIYNESNDRFDLEDKYNVLLNVVDRKSYWATENGFNTTSYVDATPEMITNTVPVSNIWPAEAITSGYYKSRLIVGMNGGANLGDGFNVRIIDDNADTTIFQSNDFIVSNLGATAITYFSIDLASGNVTNLNIGSTPLYGVTTDTASVNTRWTLQAARSAGSSTSGTYQVRFVQFVLEKV